MEDSYPFDSLDDPVPGNLDAWVAFWIYQRERKKLDPEVCCQLNFVRWTLPTMIWTRPGNKGSYSDYWNCEVIGEHKSKGYRLPVYLVSYPDLDVKFLLRNNFHDWNVSVLSTTSVSADLTGFEIDYPDPKDKTSHAGDIWGNCFFQGFPEEYQFGPFNENSYKFSSSAANNSELYSFIWLILRYLRTTKEAQS